VSRDLTVVFGGASVPLFPKHPFVSFNGGFVEKGLTDYLELAEQPSVRGWLSIAGPSKMRTDLERETGFKPENHFGYLSILNSKSLDVALALPEGEIDELQREVRNQIGGSVEFAISLDATDFVENVWRDGNVIRNALIDGPFNLSVRSKD
jgi:hypothetical protein